ncbi:MAG: hypothetical protein Fur0022_43290 [Anaerolineales bacterium]
MSVRKPFIPVTLGIVSLVAFMLGGCLSSAVQTTPTDKNLPFTAAAQTQTSVAQTIEAQLTQIAANPQSTPTPLLTAPTEASTVLPSTDVPGATPVTPVVNENCDRAAFVADVTIPDGTVFEPGETFVKTWRLRNSGECTWNAGYSVIFEQGDAMGSPASFPLTSGEVRPGEEVEISVTLKAPDEPGEYRGDWKLKNASGQVFGLGNSGNASFWALIVVGSAPDFSVFFDNVHPCDGVNHAIFTIFNNGDTLFQSAEVTLKDGNGTVIYGPVAHDGPFLGGANECPQGGDAVEPDAKAFLAASVANLNSGQNLRATFKICSQDGLGGSCTTKTLDFTMP